MTQDTVNSPTSDVVFNGTTQIWACCSPLGNGGGDCAHPSNLTFSAQPLWSFYLNAHAVNTPGAPQASQASGTGSVSSSGPTVTVTSAASHTGLSTGSEAGIGVGFAIAGIIILACLFWILKLSRRIRLLQNKSEPLARTELPVAPPYQAENSDLAKPWPAHEMQINPAPHRSELET